jgi:hypothetical protein
LTFEQEPKMTQSSSTHVSRRTTGIRTALVLAMVALASFGGIILAEYSGSQQVGVGVIGLALIAFLLVAMTRPGRK